MKLKTIWPFLTCCLLFELAAHWKNWTVVIGTAPVLCYMAIRQALHDHSRDKGERS